MRALPILLYAVVLSVAAQQEAAPTEFPAGAVPLTSAALTEALAGKTYLSKPRTDPAVRVQFRGDYAYANIGNASDTGKWRIEGSAVCYEWRKFNPSCSEIRQVGDQLYFKRSSNGEIIRMTLAP